MGSRASVITQADAARTLRAAKQAGACGVEVRPDGTIIVHLTTDTLPEGSVGRSSPPRKPVYF